MGMNQHHSRRQSRGRSAGFDEDPLVRSLLRDDETVKLDKERRTSLVSKRSEPEMME